MAKRYRTIFSVKGMGAFPIDMLRYDRCWPETGGDSAAIENPPRDFDNRAVSREIYLVHEGPERNWTPTHGRWNSFLWSVVQVRVREEIG